MGVASVPGANAAPQRREPENTMSVFRSFIWTNLFDSFSRRRRRGVRLDPVRELLRRRRHALWRWVLPLPVGMVVVEAACTKQDLVLRAAGRAAWPNLIFRERGSASSRCSARFRTKGFHD